MNDAQKKTIVDELLADTTVRGPVKSIKHIVMDIYKQWNPGYTVLVAYDKNGNWTEVKHFGEKETILRSRVLDKDGNSVSMTEFTEAGDTMRFTAYEYGEDGITKETTEDFTDDRFVGYGYEYTYEAGRLVEKQQFILRNDGRESGTSARITYEYDEQGKLIKVIDKVEKRAEITYSGDTLERIQKFGRSFIILNHLDDKGRIKGETFINEKTDEKYDEDGAIISSETTQEITSKSEYTYNPYGHVTAIIRDNSGYPDYNDRMTYKYHGYGNIVEYKEYGTHEGGREQLESFWKREFEFYK